MGTTIGAQVRAGRAALGWTQQRLADVAQVRQATVAEIECGFGAKLETLVRLARALGQVLEISPDSEEPTQREKKR